MGTVFLAEGPDGERAAVKMIRRDLADGPEFRRRFTNEVAAAGLVRSFCTPRVLGSQQDGPLLYLATEYVQGHDLRELLAGRGPFAGADLEQVAVGVATALAAIHAAGLVHRDLTPANVLLSQVGLRVIDFGVARTLNVSAANLTEPGALIGTPNYMAPEVYRAEPITTAYDVFAWGSVVVFAATGRPPFEGRTVHDTLHRIAHDRPRLTGLPAELGKVVAAAMAKDPSHRPTAWELLELLIGAGVDHDQTARVMRLEPNRPSFVLCGGEQDAQYARRLVPHLRGLGLPVHSVYERADVVDRLPGAPALIVLTSPGESDAVRHAVAEAGRLGIEVFRIVLDGSGVGGAGCYDARDGSMPGEAEIGWLRRMAAGGPEPVAEVSDDRFARLRRLLAAGDLVTADEETTALLLQAAGQGWLRQADQLAPGLLRDLGQVWTEGTGGRHGFNAQLQLHWGHQQPGSMSDFRTLTTAFGWSEKLSGKPDTYQEWVTRHTYPPGFFPTLRNPADEMQNGWYDRWRVTVMAVHIELRRGP